MICMLIGLICLPYGCTRTRSNRKLELRHECKNHCNFSLQEEYLFGFFPAAASVQVNVSQLLACGCWGDKVLKCLFWLN